MYLGEEVVKNRLLAEENAALRALVEELRRERPATDSETDAGSDDDHS